MERTILWLTENYPPQRGGMSQSCDRIVSQLRQCGYAIHVVHFTAKDGAVEEAQQINGSCLTIPFHESEAHTLQLAWQHISTRAYRMIVCFGGHLPVIAAPVYASWMSLPLVTLLRGNDFDTAIFTPRKRDLLRDVCQASTMVCTVSSDKVAKVQKLFSIRHVQYIPNGIACDEWFLSRSEREFADRWRKDHLQDKLCLGLFGQLKAKKGLSVLAEALDGSVLAERFHLLMIGEVPEESAEMLGKCGITFSALTFLDRHQLLRYYACCDAIVIPSLYDGMPNVLLEAGALGIPVIASAVDGMKDVITHKENGLLFPPANATALRKVLFDFIEYPQEARTQMGSHLKHTIQTVYTVNNKTEQYDQLFRTIVHSDNRIVGLHTSAGGSGL